MSATEAASRKKRPTENVKRTSEDDHRRELLCYSASSIPIYTPVRQTSQQDNSVLPELSHFKAHGKLQHYPDYRLG